MSTIFKKKNLILILAAVLVSVLVTSLIGVLSKGFTNDDLGTWFDKDRNPANVITFDGEYLDGKPGAVINNGKGITVEVENDGRVTGLIQRECYNNLDATEEELKSQNSYANNEMYGGKII